MKSIKWIMKHVVPVMLSLAIVLCVVVYDHEKVRATGMEEVLYYTYWDLVNSLFLAEGYSPTIDSKALQDEANRVSGEQMWEAFKYDVTRQFDDVEALAEELANLIYNATAEGIKMSPELFKALGSALNSLYGSASSDLSYERTGSFDISSIYNSVTGSNMQTYPIDTETYIPVIGTVVTSTGSYDKLFLISRRSDIHVLGLGLASDGYTIGIKYQDDSGLRIGCSMYVNVRADGSCYTSSYTLTDYNAVAVQTLWCDGVEVNESVSLKDVIDAEKVANPVDVKDDTVPWVVSTQYWTVERTETDTGSSSGSGSDDEEDKKKNRLPVVIPFVWPSTDPDNTEEESESESESESETTGTGTDTDPDTDTDIDEETLTDTVNSVLGNSGKITQLFPFCIPFDIVSMIKGMKSAKKAPVWHFEYYFKEIDYTFEFTVDMSDYEQYIKIFRAGFVIFYVITLMLLTIRYSSGIVKD